MTLVQAILVGLIYWFGNCSIARTYFVFSKPLVCGFLVGCVFGDPLTGAQVGATINMIYLGWIGAGGSTPADPCAAGTLATAFVLSAGLSTDEALVLAVPVGLVAIALYTMMQSIGVIYPRLSYKMIDDGKENLLWIPAILLPMILTYVGYGIPATIAAYLGSDIVGNVANALLGSKLLEIISLIGGVLPAVGIALNLGFIFKGPARIFVLAGFMLSVYFNLSLIAIGLVGFIAAYLYYDRTKEEATA